MQNIKLLKSHTIQIKTSFPSCETTQLESTKPSLDSQDAYVHLGTTQTRSRHIIRTTDHRRIILMT